MRLKNLLLAALLLLTGIVQAQPKMTIPVGQGCTHWQVG